MNEITTTASKWYVDEVSAKGYGIPVSHTVDASVTVYKYSEGSKVELTTSMQFNKRGEQNEMIVEAVFVSSFDMQMTGDDETDFLTLKAYVLSALDDVEVYLSDHLPASMLQIRPPLIWESKTEKLIASAFSALK